MEQQGLKELIKKGFAAMKAGSNVASQATDEIQNDAKNEQLKNALQQGNERSKVWEQRIDRCLQEAGGQADEKNEILEAHYQVSKQIRQQAPDDDSRDLGIIASGQMALHYWIAAFGTQVSYAEATGLTNSQQEMHACLDEAKEADLKHTDIAKSILAGK
jgi:ferritin-like metal-binding protein YciE